MINGWAFPDADDWMGDHIKPDGTYQGEHYYAARRYVKNFAVAVDAGAHVGTWTKLMAADFKVVHAFEPASDTFECLARNTGQLSNVTRYPVGLWDRPVRAEFLMEDRAAALKNTGARYTVPTADGPAELVTLDSYGLESVGFFKLDIEGAEPYALEGAHKTLKRCRPVILFEDKRFWMRHGLPRHAPQAFLLKLGYRQVERHHADEIWIPA